VIELSECVVDVVSALIDACFAVMALFKMLRDACWEVILRCCTDVVLVKESMRVF
jgi:hypothetical protein